MHWQLFLAGAALACGFLPAGAAAQTTTVPAPIQAVAAPLPPGPACEPSLTIPALTPVTVEMLEPLGSKISMPGAFFALRLAAPIIVDGVELLPAGASGRGEVIHAKRAGGSGAGGELVLAARFLEVCGRQLRLRSMQVSPNGKSKTGTVDSINMASAAVAPGLSLIGFMIKGGEVNVPSGTLAQAKTAELFTLAPPVQAPVPEAAPAALPATQSVQ
ncbi:hypothetical protein [Sphingomonas sp. KR3-1]|uniref:hypothetical protein n=1 Tax=Sphingomonas sp. KR3-1 TaxID=3156611 RepID=UPI0032B5133C